MKCSYLVDRTISFVNSNGRTIKSKLFYNYFQGIINCSKSVSQYTGSPSSLYEPHKEHNMASNYKGLYGVFYKMSMKVIESDNIQ